MLSPALLWALGPNVCRAISFIVGHVYGGPAGLLCELKSLLQSFVPIGDRADVRGWSVKQLKLP